MSEYIAKAQANAKKLMVDQIMKATYKLVLNLGRVDNRKIWDGYRKKLRRIL